MNNAADFQNKNNSLSYQLEAATGSRLATHCLISQFEVPGEGV